MGKHSGLSVLAGSTAGTVGVAGGAVVVGGGGVVVGDGEDVVGGAEVVGGTEVVGGIEVAEGTELDTAASVFGEEAVNVFGIVMLNSVVGAAAAVILAPKL